MNIFYHCWDAIQKESIKCKISVDKEISITNSTDENFDLPVNRLAYMYKFGIYNAHFLKKCMMTFVAENSLSLKVISEIKSSKNICSLSIGPGTDFIGLLFALKDFGYTLDENTSFRIVSKYGAWRNTVKALTSVENSKILMCKNVKLLQCDILDAISPKVAQYLRDADVLLMDHPFASLKAHKKTVKKVLKVILQFLKLGSYVFLIDTKVKLDYFKSMEYFGSFIYGPLEIQVENLPFHEGIAEAIGEKPLQSGKSYFGVWQKNATLENVNWDSPALVNVIPADYQNQSLSSSHQSSLLSTPSKQNFFPLLSEEESFFNDNATAVGESPLQSDKSCSGVWQKNAILENMNLDSPALVNVIPADFQNQSPSSSCHSSLLSTPSKQNFFPLLSEEKSFFYDNAMAVCESPLESDKSCSEALQKNAIFENVNLESPALMNVIPTDYQNQSSSSSQQSSLLSNLSKQKSNPLLSERKLFFNDISSVQSKTDIQDCENKIYNTILSSENIVGTSTMKYLESTSTNELEPLLKSFELLVTKLENLLSSDMFTVNDSTGCCNLMQKSRNCCSYCKHATDNFCLHSCLHSHRSCNSFNYLCHQTNNNMCPTLQTVNCSSYQNGPHIIIPLQNLNSDLAAQVINLALKK